MGTSAIKGQVKKKSRMGRDPFEDLQRSARGAKGEKDPLDLLSTGPTGSQPEQTTPAPPAAPRISDPVSLVGRTAPVSRKPGEAGGRSYSTYLKKQTIEMLENFAYWERTTPSRVVQELLDGYLSRQGVIKPRPATEKKLKVEFK